MFSAITLSPPNEILHELVKPLALVGGRLNGLPQFDFGNVAQEEHGTDDPPQFSKREVQLVLT
jgi:hypothetical protein